jgi:pyruvate-ferredoxin/flavodoxin oxidoreductase
VAQFAAGGKSLPKKDLAMLMMTYGNAYVARVAMGASPNQTVKAFIEAERYNGPSIIIAYAHCIAHGINMTLGYEEQKKAVNCGHWPLYRFNPELSGQGKNPLQLDSKAPSIDLADYIYNETRYKSLQQSQPEVAARLLEEARKFVKSKYCMIEKLANLQCE